MYCPVRRRILSFIAYFITLASAAFGMFPAWAYAQELPPHLIQTVTERDIYEGMLSLGYLETPLLDEEDCDSAYENVRSCIVRIQMGNAHGSGIVWSLSDERIVIVTNRHVLDYWKDENGYVHFPQGYDVDARVIGVSEKYDIGFVGVDCGQFTYEELQEIRCARVDKDVPAGLKQGDSMFLVDSGSMDSGEMYYKGTVQDVYRYIEDLDGYMVYGYCFARAGMSGGGTFDGRGHLIGMTTAGTQQNEFASVPVQHLQAAYEEIVSEGK